MRRRLRVLALSAAVASSGYAATACSTFSPPVSASTAASSSYSVIAQALGAKLTVFRSPGGKTLTRLANPNSWHDPLVLLVRQHRGHWIKVAVPIRPNGSTGWVRASDVHLEWDPFAIYVHVHTHRLVLTQFGKPLMSVPAGVGAKATPTPRGTFYLTALLRTPDPTGPYGPYAYGLSGFSPVYKSFAGGPGQIGLHGTDDASSIGHAVTHGCIRVSNNVITMFSQHLPLGTPVVVTA